MSNLELIYLWPQIPPERPEPQEIFIGKMKGKVCLLQFLQAGKGLINPT